MAFASGFAHNCAECLPEQERGRDLEDESPVSTGKTGPRILPPMAAARLCEQGRGEVRLRLDGLRSLLVLLLAILFSARLSCAAQAESTRPAPAAAASLPTLTTAHQAHSLTTDEARRAYPVHLRAVVTYFDSDTGSGVGALYVHDASGCVWVKIPGGSIKSLPPGTVVDVRGISGPGRFAPIVDKPQVTAIGSSPLPRDATPASRTALFSGQFEGQWVEVEGIVRSVFENGHYVTLELAMVDGVITATTTKVPGVDYSGLVDAKVRIHGNEAPLFNSTRQMIGARIMFPSLATVKVVEPAPGDPFQSPTILIDHLLRWDNIAAMGHRVHLRGTVTMQWPGALLCIRDASRGLCAHTTQDTRLDTGDVADVVGFVAAESAASILTDAVFRKASAGQLVPAAPATAEEALLGSHNSELIQLDGLLIGRDLAFSDTTLVLASGKSIFTVVLPKALAGPETGDWKEGSRLRVTGICSVQLDHQSSVLKDGEAVASSFRVLLGSPRDVVVLQRPSWWTAAHMLVLLALALAATLAVLGWVMVLRRSVQRQADLLRNSEELFRHMALHDALTGLATRLLLRDRLDQAVEAARRQHTGLALLMVDLDHFKLTNDTFGHSAGDEVLRVTANRLLAAVRKSDTVARLGGDEFVVLLADMTTSQIAERIAATIVENLASPVLFAGRPIPSSVSVGVCVALGDQLDADTLLRNADAALYEAKARGRNRFHVFECQGTAAPAD